jgi:hypothetical protein
MAPPAGRHRAAVEPRPLKARVWTGVAVVCATLGIGAVLPALLPVDPNWSPYGTALLTAPNVQLAEPENAEPLAASEPVSVAIPVLNVRSDVVPLGLEDDGSLEVPTAARDAGWFAQSPTPGELGPSVLAAHVDWADQEGVFSSIGDLRIGDKIEVTRADGSVAVFRVERVDSYAKADFPTDAVYGDLDHAGLRLITCGGEFDEDAGDYLNNIVVFARLTD